MQLCTGQPKFLSRLRNNYSVQSFHVTFYFETKSRFSPPSSTWWDRDRKSSYYAICTYLHSVFCDPWFAMWQKTLTFKVSAKQCSVSNCNWHCCHLKDELMHSPMQCNTFSYRVSNNSLKKNSVWLVICVESIG